MGPVLAATHQSRECQVLMRPVELSLVRMDLIESVGKRPIAGIIRIFFIVNEKCVVLTISKERTATVIIETKIYL